VLFKPWQFASQRWSGIKCKWLQPVLGREVTSALVLESIYELADALLYPRMILCACEVAYNMTKSQESPPRQQKERNEEQAGECQPSSKQHKSDHKIPSTVRTRSHTDTSWELKSDTLTGRIWVFSAGGHKYQTLSFIK